MKIVKFLVSTVGLISGIITIVSIFVTPEVIKKIITKDLPLVIDGFSYIFQYAYTIVFIPIIFGIVHSRQHNGFVRIDPLHLISSIVIYPFWIGFIKGIKVIGAITALLAFFIVLFNSIKGAPF